MYLGVIYIYTVYLMHFSQCRVVQVSFCGRFQRKNIQFQDHFNKKNFNSKHMTLKHDLYVNIT